jgi:hypothetical protein
MTRCAIDATDAARCIEDRRSKMGPREKALGDSAIENFPPDGAAYFADRLGMACLERRQLLDALEEALNGWEDAAQYKSEFLAKKHGDSEDIARLRKVLGDADE